MTVLDSAPPTRVPATPYARPTPIVPGGLRLDGNEGSRPARDLLAAAAELPAAALRDYPDLAPLTRTIARRHGVDPRRVVVTAGAAEAIDRALRAWVAPGDRLVVPRPTFEMILRFAATAGADVDAISWSGRFPTERLIERLEEPPAMVAVVSPNNPTGEALTAGDLERVAAAAGPAIVLFDHVYAEYADRDLTAAALELPNVVVLRTLSKAWGLAGCRVGYALARPELAAVLRAAGNAYPVAAISAEIARRRLESGGPEVAAHVARVRSERRRLVDWLAARGLPVPASQANFVLVNLGRRAAEVRERLAELGVTVRAFPHREEIAGCLRISLPGDAAELERLLAALATALDGAPGGESAQPTPRAGTEDSGPEVPDAASADSSPRSGAATDAPPTSTASAGPAASTTLAAGCPEPRTAIDRRATAETRVEVALSLDGRGAAQVDTGIGFLDHLLTALARHARIDLELSTVGDLEVDDHHTAEDSALALGRALDRALGDRSGVCRFGSAHAPLDEALARAVVDLSGRPFARVELGLTRERLGGLACENVSHVLASLATAANLTLHVEILAGANDHHRAEAAFKATALALRQAVARSGFDDVASTKRTLVGGTS